MTVQNFDQVYADTQAAKAAVSKIAPGCDFNFIRRRRENNKNVTYIFLPGDGILKIIGNSFPENTPKVRGAMQWAMRTSFSRQATIDETGKILMLETNQEF